MKIHSFLPVLGAILIGVLACLLYVPFLSNTVVFDDQQLFTRLTIYDYAQSPFDFRPRTFPYFTLGLVQVEIGSIEANRIVNLALHILCSWMLFALITSLLRQAFKIKAVTSNLVDEKQIESQAIFLGIVGACWFAISPVAVYGAGYLIQRTILFATLFSLLSLWFYRRAFAENRTSDLITSALFYSAAVFSKEHAIMLPLAAVPLSMLYSQNFRSNARKSFIYLLLCLPAAIVAVLSVKFVVAASYEPDSVMLISSTKGLPFFDTSLGRWTASILMQAKLFFDYFSYWIIPDTRSMSADIRVDFVQVWSVWFIAKFLLFLGCPIAGLYLVLRGGGSQRLFGCGLLYAWVLYLTELVSIRIQEPFVLYRSYLWAPGYILMIVAIFRTLPFRWVLTAAIPIFLISFHLAQERLASLKDEGSVWKDAAAKLQSESILGSDRIFYNRGLQYIRERKFNNAIEDFSRVIARNPDISQFYYQRGIAYYSSNDFLKAEEDFARALVLNNRNSSIHYAHGMTLEKLGCMQEAIEAYSQSLKLGLLISEMSLKGAQAKERVNQEKGQVSKTRPCPLAKNAN